MWINFTSSNITVIQVKSMENNYNGILALFGLAKLILSQFDNLFTLLHYPLCIVDFACSCALGWSGEACDIDCGCNNHSTCLTGQGACDECQGYTTGMQVYQKSVLKRFPKCNFSLEFPEILSRNHIYAIID